MEHPLDNKNVLNNELAISIIMPKKYRKNAQNSLETSLFKGYCFSDDKTFGLFHAGWG